MDRRFEVPPAHGKQPARPVFGPRRGPGASLLALQRSAGNRATTALLGAVQRAPVGGPDGSYVDASEGGVELDLVERTDTGDIFQIGGSSVRVRWTGAGYVDAASGGPIAPGTLRTLALERHFGARQSALEVHEAALADEATKSKAVHGRARHGFQTGWEGQRDRATTKVTPDQPDDPYGTKLSEGSRAWKTSTGQGRALTVKGKVVPTPLDATGRPQALAERKPKPTKSGGPYAGAFFSPEHQNDAINVALTRAKVFETWHEARFTGYAKGDGWAPLQFVEVVVMERKEGYGYAFGRNPTDGQYATEIVGSALGRGGNRVFAIKCAKVQLKRSSSGWDVLSSFPENLPPGASPVQAHGEFPWTGDLRRSTGEATTLVAPVWPHSKKDG